MTPTPIAASSRPGTSPLSMPDMPSLDARYLQALSMLTPYHAHDLRGRIGTAAIQLDLAHELLARSPLAPANIERARTETSRARAVLRDMSGALEGWLGFTRAAQAGEASFDLCELVGEIEAALAPVARDRRCECRVTLPARAARTGCLHAVARQALLVAAVTVLDTVPPGGRLEIALVVGGNEATIAFTGAGADGAAPTAMEAGRTLELIAAALESNAGTARADAPGRLSLVFPIQPMSD